MKAVDGLRKAEATSLWCYLATEISAKAGDKPWHYLLVPESGVQDNFTVSGLEVTHTRTPNADLLQHYTVDGNRV